MINHLKPLDGLVKSRLDSFFSKLDKRITSVFIRERVFPLLQNLFALYGRIVVNITYRALGTRLGIVLTLFATIYGVIGVASERQTTPGQIFTLYCWVIVMVSTLSVPLIFYYPAAREFLYSRIGKERVIFMVGNPGLVPVARATVVVVGAVGW